MLFGHGNDERSMLVLAERGRSSSSESEQILRGIFAVELAGWLVTSVKLILFSN